MHRRHLFYLTVQAKYHTHDQVEVELHATQEGSSQAQQLPKGIFLCLTLQSKHHNHTVEQASRCT